jgi:hypothetical protein
MQTPVASGPDEYGGKLRNNALNLVGGVGLALGWAAPTVDRASVRRVTGLFFAVTLSCSRSLHQDHRT